MTNVVTHREPFSKGRLFHMEPGVARQLVNAQVKPFVDRDELTGTETLRFEGTAAGGPISSTPVPMGSVVRIGTQYLTHLATHYDESGHVIRLALQVL